MGIDALEIIFNSNEKTTINLGEISKQAREQYQKQKQKHKEKQKISKKSDKK